MAESTVPKVPRDGLITFSSGDGTPKTYPVTYENGNVSFGREKAERIVIRDRGSIVGSRKGDDPVLQITFDVHMRMFTTTANTNTDLTIIDVMDNTGSVAAIPWTKTNTAHEEWCLDLIFTVEGSDHGDGADHTVTFSDCIFTWEFSEGSPNTISVTAECMGGYASTGPS